MTVTQSFYLTLSGSHTVMVLTVIMCCGSRN